MVLSTCSPGYLQDAVNRGSLAGTGSHTGSEAKEENVSAITEEGKTIETTDEDEWLGDQESNLGSQIQNLLSCP